MKKILSTLLLLFVVQITFACEVCQQNQPKVLKNVTHGPGPQGDVDFIIIWSAVAIVGVTLFLSVKYLVRPKEGNPEHIKNIVISDN